MFCAPAGAFFGPVVELAYTSDLKSDARFGLAGSSPAGATKYSGLAQLVEQTAVNRRVAGSSPAAGAITL